jgi:hypothetical protein
MCVERPAPAPPIAREVLEARVLVGRFVDPDYRKRMAIEDKFAALRAAH